MQRKGKNETIMDENTWRFAQLMMWVIGIQTTVIMASLGVIWAYIVAKFNKIDKRFERLEEKIEDIDRRICRLEGAFSAKECCMIKEERHLKKVE